MRDEVLVLHKDFVSSCKKDVAKDVTRGCRTLPRVRLVRLFWCDLPCIDIAVRPLESLVIWTAYWILFEPLEPFVI